MNFMKNGKRVDDFTTRSNAKGYCVTTIYNRKKIIENHNNIL